MLGLSELLSQLPKKYETIVVDCFLFDSKKRVLLQRRSMNRKLFPGFWDAIGGHLEPGESIEECLRREIKEETSMDLTRIHALVHQFDWNSEGSAVNLQFVAEAEGTPIPEEGKVTELRWVDRDELEKLGVWLTIEMKTGVLAALAYIERI
jgi:8-oxo-dGTP diphosphatase